MVRATPSPTRAFDYALVPMGGNPTEQHDPADRFIDDLAPEPDRRPYDSYRYEALVTGPDR